jgi:hypothetical protein
MGTPPEFKPQVAKVRLLREKYPPSMFSVAYRSRVEVAIETGDVETIKRILLWDDDWC